MDKLAVVAFGGNALLRGDQVGTIDDQEKNTYDSCMQLIPLIKEGYGLVITHGNGPQVGNIMLRNEAGFEQFKIPRMPLDICVADSQGGIGYMIERMMRNALNAEGIEKEVVTMVTQVLVDKFDPAFEDPTKPIGGYYLKEEADLLAKTNGFKFKEDPRRRGWRRVVASPKPLDIFNHKVIENLARTGTIVIASGGGGIPVFKHEDNHLEAIEAVIDKDLASSLLGNKIKADEFYILTDVPKAYINFNKPDQKQLDKVSIEEAEGYLTEGQFGSGSMGPKVKAAIQFVANGGKKTVITEASQLKYDNCGTRIVQE